MRYLLDTHALLWAITDPDRLGAEVRRTIADRSNPLVVSAASAWQIATKQRAGKLPQADALVGAYSRHLDRLGVERLPVTEEHALLAGSLQWEHRDPFDRMIAAQAMLESMPIVTGDAVFAELPGVATVW